MKRLSFIGIAALLSSCDDNSIKTLAECEMGNLTVKAEYSERRLASDNLVLKFYLENSSTPISTIEPSGADDREYYTTVIYCNDGKEMHVEFNAFSNDTAYFK